MLGNKVNFKKAKIPSKKFLTSKHVVLEPININKHSKDFEAYRLLHFCNTESFYTFIPHLLFTLSNIILIFLNFNGLE